MSCPIYNSKRSHSLTCKTTGNDERPRARTGGRSRERRGERNAAAMARRRRGRRTLLGESPPPIEQDPRARRDSPPNKTISLIRDRVSRAPPAPGRTNLPTKAFARARAKEKKHKHPRERECPRPAALAQTPADWRAVQSGIEGLISYPRDGVPGRRPVERRRGDAAGRTGMGSRSRGRRRRGRSGGGGRRSEGGFGCDGLVARRRTRPRAAAIRPRRAGRWIPAGHAWVRGAARIRRLLRAL